MGKRSTDGITLNKVVVSIAGFSVITLMSVVTWVYSKDTDRTQTTFVKMGQSMDEAVGEIRKIREQGITLYSHVENNSAAIMKNSEDDEKFREETRRYWGQPK